MFDHVTIRVSDLEASRRFYTLALGEPTHVGEQFTEWDDFSISTTGPVTRHLHVAFVARSRDEVDEWWRRLTDAGYRDDGAPGPRPQYHPDYYGAFVLDPDGNSAESVQVGRKDLANRIDHMWIGVRDLDASMRFWETVCPLLGIHIAHVEAGERFHIGGGDRSFGLVHDGRPPTENLHIAFGTDDDARVDEFHRVATAAGFRDNGPPGERPVYHAGYYGAYVLDPDGTNVELVNHHR
jgi:catechol 2,3-dioxygenase-like lactoylglutathione lyase family enzyme